MNSLMKCEVCIHTEKSPATYTSFIWFLSSMNCLMYSKVLTCSETLATYITFIWFHSSMKSPMNSKVCSMTKRLITYIAFVWLLSSMNPLMKCKSCSLIKGLAIYIPTCLRTTKPVDLKWWFYALRLGSHDYWANTQRPCIATRESTRIRSSCTVTRW